MAELIDHPTAGPGRRLAGEHLPRLVSTSPGALLDEVYDLGDRRLGWDYAYRATPIVEHRLVQAGVRLAGLLDRLLGPTAAPNPPGAVK